MKDSKVKVARKRAASNRSRKFRRATKWLCLFAVLAFIIDAVLYEPYHPVLTTYDVAVPGLPESLDGFRVVQLSDFHRSLAVPGGPIDRAVQLANGAHADVALLTGDFVSRNAANATSCCNSLSKLRTTRGAYAVLGNHDYWTNAPKVSRAITNSGIKLLTNRGLRLPDGLWLVGVDDEWSGAPDEVAAFRDVKPGDPCVMLCHEPISIKRFAGRTGLLVTGHTHGGQVNLPIFTKRLVALTHHGSYVWGWYRQGGVLMYVNRGIGTVFPPVRFRCRPEVTLFILHPTTRSRPCSIAAGLDLRYR